PPGAIARRKRWGSRKFARDEHSGGARNRKRATGAPHLRAGSQEPRRKCGGAANREDAQASSAAPTRRSVSWGQTCVQHVARRRTRSAPADPAVDRGEPATTIAANGD